MYYRAMVRRWVPLAVVLLTTTLTGAPPGRAPAPLRVRGPLSPRAVEYDIKATLLPASHTITGQLKLRLRNTADVALDRLRFHLYLNAFSGPKTLFMRSSKGKLRLSRADPDAPGWIRVTSVTSGGARLRAERLEDGTVLQVWLHRPLAAGQQRSVRLRFTSRLPRVFARTGHAGEFQMLAQWYPKLGFLRADGSWHCPAFHSHSEFFGPFGSYRVRLRLPARYRVGATGVRLSRALDPADPSQQVLQLAAVDVHDFAVAAWPHFTEQLGRAGDVSLRLLSVPGRQGQTRRQLRLLRLGLRKLGRWFGPYPYSELTVVDVPTNALGAGAMEYPTLFTSWTPWWVPAGVHATDQITVHELVHQYFQGMLASNEVQDPWLDEGVTTYVTGLLMDELYGAQRSLLDLPWGVRLGQHHKDRLRIAGGRYRRPRPVALAADKFASWSSYGRTVYARAALTLATVESLIGRRRMLRVLGQYARRHRFGHPTTADLERALVQGSPAAVRPLVKDLLRGALHQGLRAGWSVRCHRGRVELRREGQLRLPLELELTRADGSVVTRSWDGHAAAVTWPVAGLHRARLLPQRRLSLDPRIRDNACQVSGGASQGVASVTALAQTLLQLVGP